MATMIRDDEVSFLALNYRDLLTSWRTAASSASRCRATAILQ